MLPLIAVAAAATLVLSSCASGESTCRGDTPNCENGECAEGYLMAEDFTCVPESFYQKTLIEDAIEEEIISTNEKAINAALNLYYAEKGELPEKLESIIRDKFINPEIRSYFRFFDYKKSKDGQTYSLERVPDQKL